MSGPFRLARRPAAPALALAALAGWLSASGGLAPPTSAASPAAGAAAPAAASASARPAAADCVPVLHTKRVVKRKKVRRHGKWVRVKRKRVKRWWTCEPAPEPPGCAVPASALGVSAYDLGGSRFVLSRPCVDAGAVNVELRNQGEDPHNLFMRPSGQLDPAYTIPEQEPFELAPLGVQDRTVALTPGQWYLWCDLLTHEQQGMNATLTVR